MSDTGAFVYLLGLISSVICMYSIYHCYHLYRVKGFEAAKKWISWLSTEICSIFTPYAIIVCSLLAVYLWTVEIKEFIPLGTYCYNVAITTPSGTYTVPAEIERVLVDVDEDTTRPEFHINRIYWPNGGYFDFEDFNEVEIGKTTSCYAIQEEDFVDIYLFDDRSIHPRINEDYGKKPYGMFNTVVLGASFAIFLAVLDLKSFKRK